MHTLQLDDNGNIDFMAFDIEDADGFGHNGPLCTKCNAVWCRWCTRGEPWLTEDCD